LGDYLQGIRCYQKALALKPRDEYNWYNQACCAAQLQQASLAVECLQQAIAINPQNRDLSQTDPDFLHIRNNHLFQGI
jgi:tetratricopeptide (TPR) repeat protein